MRRWIAPLSLALSAWTGWAHAQDLSPTERLHQVREALIQAAMKRPVAVTATQWMDGQGQLRQSSEFRSGMVVRGVQVQGPQDPQAERYPQADMSPEQRVAWLQSHDLIETACERKNLGTQTPKHSVRWQLSWQGPMSAQSRWDMHRLQVAIEQSLWPRSEQSQDMVLIQPPAVQGAYERAWLGNASNDTALRLQLSLRRIDPREAASRSYQIEWSLRDQHRGSVWWSRQQVVNLPLRDPKVSPRSLDPDTQQQLSVAMEEAQQALGQILRCQAPRYELTQTPDRRWRIPAGTRNGLRRGDQLLLMPSGYRPGDEWDPKRLEQVALVQIQDLTDNDAQVVPYAGPKPTPHQSWVVMPRMP